MIAANEQVPELEAGIVASISQAAGLVLVTLT